MEKTLTQQSTNKSVNSSLLTWIILFSAIAALTFSFLSYQSLQQLLASEELRYQSYILAENTRLRFEKTISKARSYAMVGDEKYLQEYYQVLINLTELPQINSKSIDPKIDKQTFNKFLSKREARLQQQLFSLVFTDEELQLLKLSQRYSLGLLELESQAFAYVEKGLNKQRSYKHSEERQFALSILYSEEYFQLKSQVMEVISVFLQSIDKRSSLQVDILKADSRWKTILALFFCFSLILLLAYNLFLNKKNKKLFVKSLRKEVANRTFELFEKREQLKSIISEMKQTKDQLVESEKMASLGNLVSGVAHEVNTPLGVSVTLASHLKDETQHLEKNIKEGTLKRSDLEAYCSESSENCYLLLSNLERAAGLIRSFKQVAVDQSCESSRQIKMGEYLQEVLLSLHPKLKKTAIKIEIDCPDDRSVNTYPGTLAQIMTNLVLNAIIHAFDNGKESGEILFSIHFKDQQVQFNVTDNGRGMEPQIKEKIFDPFFTTQRGNGGSGLGMSIVYNLVVHQLGGTIKCESVLTEGTSFLMAFPIES